MKAKGVTKVGEGASLVAILLVHMEGSHCTSGSFHFYAWQMCVLPLENCIAHRFMSKSFLISVEYIDNKITNFAP